MIDAKPRRHCPFDAPSIVSVLVALKAAFRLRLCQDVRSGKRSNSVEAASMSLEVRYAMLLPKLFRVPAAADAHCALNLVSPEEAYHGNEVEVGRTLTTAGADVQILNFAELKGPDLNDKPAEAWLGGGMRGGLHTPTRERIVVRDGIRLTPQLYEAQKRQAFAARRLQGPQP